LTQSLCRLLQRLHPADTVMDLNIGAALWFAARASGYLKRPPCNGAPISLMVPATPVPDLKGGDACGTMASMLVEAGHGAAGTSCVSPPDISVSYPSNSMSNFDELRHGAAALRTGQQGRSIGQDDGPLDSSGECSAPLPARRKVGTEETCYTGENLCVCQPLICCEPQKGGDGAGGK
jgi:hypothetical protein